MNRRNPERFRTRILISVFFLASVVLGRPSWTAAQSTPPQIVTLKNGAQFEGQIAHIQSYSESVSDSLSTGTKPIMMVDDGLRRVFFAQSRVANTADSDRAETEIRVWQNVWKGSSEGHGLLVGIGRFDEYGHRWLRVQTRSGIEEFYQGITLIGPRFCRLEALTKTGSRQRRWTMSVGTSAIPMDILHSVLRKQIKDDQSPNEYLEIVDFFVDAQQYKRAITELKFIQDKFPDLKDQIEDDRKQLQQIYSRSKILNEARTRFRVGQSQLANALANVFVKEGVAGEIVAEMEDIQNQIAAQQNNVVLVRQAVSELIAKMKTDGSLDQSQSEMVKRFSDELETELNVDNVARLDAFRLLANDRATPDEQKLALAISGWLMSSNLVVNNFAVVQSMLPVRDLIREYLTTDSPVRRTEILGELGQFEAGQPPYLANLIAWMKPTEPPDELGDYTGEQPIEFFVKVKGTKTDPDPKQFRCLVHLPPQYSPYRQYPCILTLRPGIDLEQQLNRWAGGYNENLGIRMGRAIRNGYIVVAVDWKEPGQSTYQYSLREHATVLKALRKSLRMFSIDADRVFLAGHSSGATAAYDIGLSHPEHWAGIVGIGGQLEKYTYSYSDNRHVDLPIYSVVGQKDITAKTNKKTWNQWLHSDRYLDCVLVEYKGRLNEPFHEEMPSIFEWMAAHRRILPDKSGFELDFETLRPWDNYFWFWELHGFPESSIQRPEHWSPKLPKHPVKMTVKLSANQPNVFIGVGPKKTGTHGTIWLSPDLVDFNKKIIIQGRGRGFRDFVKPSARVLLDDVRRRADRKHPYWARIDCNEGVWKVPRAAGDGS